MFLPYEEWYQFARTHNWESDEVRAIAIPMVLVGIAVLVLGLAPWRPSLINVYDGDAAEIHVRRRSVARSLERAVQHVDGVDRCFVEHLLVQGEGSGHHEPAPRGRSAAARARAPSPTTSPAWVSPCRPTCASVWWHPRRRHEAPT